MIRSKEYRRIVKEMAQVESEKHDGIDELAFLPSSSGSSRRNRRTSYCHIWMKRPGMMMCAAI